MHIIHVSCEGVGWCIPTSVHGWRSEWTCGWGCPKEEEEQKAIHSWLQRHNLWGYLHLCNAICKSVNWILGRHGECFQPLDYPIGRASSAWPSMRHWQRIFRHAPVRDVINIPKAQPLKDFVGAENGRKLNQEVYGQPLDGWSVDDDDVLRPEWQMWWRHGSNWARQHR